MAVTSNEDGTVALKAGCFSLLDFGWYYPRVALWLLALSPGTDCSYGDTH